MIGQEQVWWEWDTSNICSEAMYETLLATDSKAYKTVPFTLKAASFMGGLQLR